MITTPTTTTHPPPGVLPIKIVYYEYQLFDPWISFLSTSTHWVPDVFSVKIELTIWCIGVFLCPD